MRQAAVALAFLAGACTSAWNDGDRLTYTAEEMDRALAPLRQIEQRCYQGSPSQRDKQTVKLEFVLYIDERGAVHSDPRDGYPRDPALLECLRQGLDGLSFPAKGEADQARVGIELKP